MTVTPALRRLARLAMACLLVLLGAPSWAQNTQPQKYSADVPSWITTPDTVQTRIGTLNFHNGVPDEKTVQLLDDQIDFMRGVEAFLNGMSATSIRDRMRSSRLSKEGRRLADLDCPGSASLSVPICHYVQACRRRS